jgi:hypothetical protein
MLDSEPRPQSAFPEVEREQSPEAAPKWSPTKRALFRFTFAYFALYLFPFPLDVIPYVGIVTQPYETLQSWVVTGVGKHLFHVEIAQRLTGSGDTTYAYVQSFCVLAFAVVATLVWSVLDRGRASYARLYEWLRIYVRFGLATAMISYGAAKVIPSQFPRPSVDRLIQPFGDASPMGLLWTFMGASAAYVIFTGAAEMLGGLLLLARRTTLLGALVCIAVLVNVVMLNFCYDVPVKLYSSHLLLMAMFLAAPDLRRLTSLLVLNRDAPRAEIRPLFERQALNRAALVVRTVFLLGFAGMALYGTWNRYQENFAAGAPKPPLQGLWEVEELKVDGQVRPAVLSDATRWRWVVFDYPGMLGVHSMTQSRERYFIEVDTRKRTIALTKRDDPDWKTVASYQQPGPGLLTLQGTFDGRKVQARLRRTEPPEFRLLTRGFHWISEAPFNR